MAKSGLPIGFKFQPTDKLVICLLNRWVDSGGDLSVLPRSIAATNVYDSSPEKLLAGRTEAYFLTPRRRKHKSGTYIDRQASGGAWRITKGRERSDILHVVDGKTVVVGRKLVLSFHAAGFRMSTGYVMYEYESCILDGGSSVNPDVDYVICCIKLNPQAMRAVERKKKLAGLRSSAQYAAAGGSSDA